jgi:pimeloyl-ACP methyl ester carboxylesterase
VIVPAYLEQGSGDVAVVMLHGVGGGKEAWPRQLEFLAARGCRVVAWDMPGYGASAAIEPYTMAGLADALQALLDRLGARTNVVLGHSMGGMVAQEAYARSSARIHGLILSGTSPAFGKPDGEWQQQFLAARLAPLDAGRTMADVAEKLVPTMIGEAPDAAGLALARALMAAVPISTYRAALHALMGFDRREALGRVTVPTLVLAGERDTTAPPAVMRKMAEKIPGAQYRELPGAGHLANLEQPDAFNAVLDVFLITHFRTRAARTA